MTFKPELVPDFIAHEEKIHSSILGFEGCRHLQILRDINQENVFFSYSHWDKEQNLINYRNSDFFQNTWTKLKTMFADKPEAWSTEVIM